MTLPVVAIRPEPGCGITASTARSLGLAVECHPLFEVVAVPWSVPDGHFDGLLIGSANVFRAGGPNLEKLAGLPVYAVGESTAAAAWECGFRIGAVGAGQMQGVLDGLAGQRLRLLRIAGEEHVPLAPPEGIEMLTVAAYRMENLPCPQALATLLDKGGLVLIHSAAAARHFADEVDRLGLSRQEIALAVLARRVADAAGGGWGAVRVAREPNDPALLALAREMCHEPFVGRDGRQ